MNATAAVGRQALLIGNGRYQHLPALASPSANVGELAQALEKAGFTVTVEHELSQTATIAALRRFVATVPTGDFVFFYFSGYGFQADELNYLVPVDFDPKDESSPGAKAYSVRNLQSQLEASKAG